MTWLYIYLGIKGFGPWYGFWSGFGGILERLLELVVLASLLLYRHNCHEPRCFRMGRHLIDGRTWCHRHHEGIREKIRKVL